MWGGLVRIISTHNGAHNAFNELVSEIRAGRRPYSLHRTTFDEALADGLYRKICEQTETEWSEEKQREWRQQIVDYYGDNVGEELFCIPRASSGAYLSSVLIEARMKAGIPILRWEMPAEFSGRPEAHRYSETQAWCEDNIGPAIARLDPARASFFGEDFGRSGDLTVIWPLQIDKDLTRRTPFVVELRNIPFRNQEQVLFYIVDRLPRFTTGAMDARGNGQYLAETAAQRYGARIVQVMLSEAWYRENMPRYKAAFEDGTIEIPKDADVLVGPSRDRARKRRRKNFGTPRRHRRQGTSRRLSDGSGARVLRVARGSGSYRIHRSARDAEVGRTRMEGKSVRLRTDGG